MTGCDCIQTLSKLENGNAVAPDLRSGLDTTGGRVIGSSDQVHVVDALAITGDEGRGSLRKASGSWQTSIDPKMSEWGNPPVRVPPAEYIGGQELTC